MLGRPGTRPGMEETRIVSEEQMSVCALGASELAVMYRNGAITPLEVVSLTLERIDSLNPLLNAFLEVLHDDALLAAEAATMQLRAGVDLGALHGIPVSVKGNMDLKGTRNTAASKILLDTEPAQEDAPVVGRLRRAGAVILGRANLAEFAIGEPDVDGPFGRVDNPRRTGHQAGSSSSGSAAAVAAGLGPLSLGTDTGGSVRYPASVCGIVGLKPTYGLVPIEGIIPISTSLDHVGILARSSIDAAIALTAISGHHAADPYSRVYASEDYADTLSQSVDGLRLGIPTNEWFSFGDATVRDLLSRTEEMLVDLGMTRRALTLPDADKINDIHHTILGVDFLVTHERYSNRQDLYTRNLAQRMKPWREVNGTDYARAKVAQERSRLQWLDELSKVDALLLPANSVGAPAHGRDEVIIEGTSYPVLAATSRFNRPANLFGLPSITVPIGVVEGSLPIGAQLVGLPGADGRLLAIAGALEAAMGDLTRQWGIEPVEPQLT